MSDKYILQGHDAVPADDLLEWGRWMQSAERTVARTELSSGTRVSTIFLGLDHNFGFGEPQVFETMVFGGPMDQYMDRYAAWDEAERGHATMVERVKAAESGAA